MNLFDTPCESPVGQSLIETTIGESVECPKPVRLMFMFYSGNAAWNQQSWNSQIGNLAIAVKEYVELAPARGFDEDWEMVIIWFHSSVAGLDYDNPNPPQSNIDDPDLDFNELDDVILDRLTINQQPPFGNFAPDTPSDPQAYVDYVTEAAAGRVVQQVVFVVEWSPMGGIEGLNRNDNAFELGLDLIAQTFGLFRPDPNFPTIPFFQSLDVLERGRVADLTVHRWPNHFTEVLLCWFPVPFIGLPPPTFGKCEFEQP